MLDLRSTKFFANCVAFGPESFFFFSILSLIACSLGLQFFVTIGLPYIKKLRPDSKIVNGLGGDTDIFFWVLKMGEAVLAVTTLLFAIQLAYYYPFTIVEFGFGYTLCNDLFAVSTKLVVCLFSTYILSSSTLYFRTQSYTRPEYVIVFLILIFSVLLGLTAADLLLFYLSLELQSLSLYVLVFMYPSSTYKYDTLKTGVEYFYLSVVASAFFLCGLGWLYLSTGSLNYAQIHLFNQTAAYGEQVDMFSNLSRLFILGVIFFKLGLFPFYYWVARVYNDVSLPTVFFLAVVSKIFAFAVFVRFIYVFTMFDNIISWAFYCAGVISILYGVAGALSTREIRRIIAYSSISQLGVVTIGLSLSNPLSLIASVFYFYIYIALVFSLFYFLLSVQHQKLEKDGSIKDLAPFHYVEDLEGIYEENWFLALFLATIVFSLAGIPPFAGFFAKYIFFYYLVTNGYYGTFFFLFAASVISTLYYLGLIIEVYSRNNRSLKLMVRESNFYMIVAIFIANLFSFLFLARLWRFIILIFIGWLNYSCRIKFCLFGIAPHPFVFMLNISIRCVILLRVASLKGDVMRALMSLFALIRLNFLIFCRIQKNCRGLLVGLLVLLMTQGISKYYTYSARPSFYKETGFASMFKRVETADFLQVEFFTDGFFHITFFGICLSKTVRGLGSSMVISDQFTLKQRFFVFSPCLQRVVIFSRRLKKIYI